jgi:hypothetical protein
MPDQPQNAGGPRDDATDARASARPNGASRPIVERIGLLLVALVLAALFGAVGAAAFVNGELFLGAMGLAGAVMTIWAGAQTMRPG